MAVFEENDSTFTKMDKIIQDICIEVTNNLYPFSSEAEYQNGMLREFQNYGIRAKSEVPAIKTYKGEDVDGSKYDRIDILISSKNDKTTQKIETIIELKVVAALSNKNRYQLLGYLKERTLSHPNNEITGYLVNFREKDGTVEIEKIKYQEDPIIHKWYYDRIKPTDYELQSFEPESPLPPTNRNELNRADLKKLFYKLTESEPKQISLDKLTKSQINYHIKQIIDTWDKNPATQTDLLY